MRPCVADEQFDVTIKVCEREDSRSCLQELNDLREGRLRRGRSGHIDRKMEMYARLEPPQRS